MMNALVEHRYTCVLERNDSRITLDVYSPQPLAGPDLLPLAINEAIEHAALIGDDTAVPEDYAPIGFVEVTAWD